MFSELKVITIKEPDKNIHFKKQNYPTALMFVLFLSILLLFFKEVTNKQAFTIGVIISFLMGLITFSLLYASWKKDYAPVLGTIIIFGVLFTVHNLNINQESLTREIILNIISTISFFTYIWLQINKNFILSQGILFVYLIAFVGFYYDTFV